ncbi:SUA5/YciO/YrdC family translation initiation protein, partial [Ectopseudomonas mendocina]
MPFITSDFYECAARLRAGHLVAMPTETVYGLAADARQDA